MTDCVILFRNTQNDAVGYVTEGDTDEIRVFGNRDEAIEASGLVPVCQAFPFQIVELDEI